MNPTGEWLEYHHHVMESLKRFENELVALRERRESDREEFLQRFERIQSGFIMELEKIRSEFRDKEVARLEAELAAAKAALEVKGKSESPEPALVKEDIIRDHKVDSFFAARSKLFWGIMLGGVGTLWAVVEFIVEPLIKGGGG